MVVDTSSQPRCCFEARAALMSTTDSTDLPAGSSRCRRKSTTLVWQIVFVVCMFLARHQTLNVGPNLLLPSAGFNMSGCYCNYNRESHSQEGFQTPTLTLFKQAEPIHTSTIIIYIYVYFQNRASYSEVTMHVDSRRLRGTCVVWDVGNCPSRKLERNKDVNLCAFPKLQGLCLSFVFVSRTLISSFIQSTSKLISKCINSWGLLSELKPWLCVSVLL